MKRFFSQKILCNVPERERISSIEIPASVESIGERCFYECKSLSEVTFCDRSQLNTIDKKAFYESGLTKICIPANVESIGEFCFCYCKLLSEVTF